MVVSKVGSFPTNRCICLDSNFLKLLQVLYFGAAVFCSGLYVFPFLPLFVSAAIRIGTAESTVGERRALAAPNELRRGAAAARRRRSGGRHAWWQRQRSWPRVVVGVAFSRREPQPSQCGIIAEVEGLRCERLWVQTVSFLLFLDGGGREATAEDLLVERSFDVGVFYY